MSDPTIEQIMVLKNQPLAEIKTKYEEIFKGENPTSNNKAFLWRKIAYRMQEIELGGLSEPAQARIQELIKLYDPINNKFFRPETASSKGKSSRDRRLPIVGTEIIKKYKGQQYVIKVIEKGFEYNGKIYRSLSRIAEEITGIHWNGYAFFNL